MGRLLVGVAAGALLMGAGIHFYHGMKGGHDVASDSPQASEEVTVADAEAFVAEAESEFREFGEFAARTAWVQNNFITHDTNWQPCLDPNHPEAMRLL